MQIWKIELLHSYSRSTHSVTIFVCCVQPQNKELLTTFSWVLFRFGFQFANSITIWPIMTWVKKSFLFSCHTQGTHSPSHKFSTDSCECSMLYTYKYLPNWEACTTTKKAKGGRKHFHFFYTHSTQSHCALSEYDVMCCRWPRTLWKLFTVWFHCSIIKTVTRDP